MDNVNNQINLKLANLLMSQLDWTPDTSIGKETKILQLGPISSEKCIYLLL